LDFTIETYKRLLNTLSKQGFSFQPFMEFITIPSGKAIILRHDVDLLPGNSLKFAKIEAKNGIKGTYYFRIVPGSFNEKIIKEIYSLGHEIGYHYETMDTCRGDVDKAYNTFCENLELFRKIYPVKTICMHGSPLSKYDNRDIWKKYDYRNLGILGEPYFDVDYSKVFYITDTGRMWNNKSSNIRDVVKCSINIPIKSTNHLILLIEQGKLPDKIMINTHPHRWFDGGFGWYKEFLLQNTKNKIKWMILNVKHDTK